MNALAPIRVNYTDHPTVQSALLAVLKNHEDLATRPWMDAAKYPNAPAEMLTHLLNDLRAIRDGIAARAPVDAGEGELAS